MLNKIALDLWVAEQPQTFAGIEVGTRMTVIRLESGDLILHSPISPNLELRRQLDDLGTVRYLIAPNRFHHLYVGMYPKFYPEAMIFVAPGLEQKRSDLPVHGLLGDEAPTTWRQELRQLVFRGYPLMNEVVFLHIPTRTLILSDLAVNFPAHVTGWTRWALRLGGALDRFGPTRIERFLIRDRETAKKCLREILEWDFDRVIVAHGDILPAGGRVALAEGYRWLLTSI